MFKKKLIIHAGMHKTGTSSIQGTLFLNREYLEHYGINYPLIGLAHDPEVGQRHLHLSNMLKRHEFDEVKFKQVILELNALDAHTVVISHEDIFRKDIVVKGIELLNETFDVSLILYVKDPIIYFNDKYKEWVRRRECKLEPGDFVLAHLDYLAWHNILPIWEKHIGKKNIYIREFSPSKVKGADFISDFYQKLIEISKCPVDTSRLEYAPRTNESLSNDQILMKLMALQNNQSDSKNIANPPDEKMTTQSEYQSRPLVLSRECARQIKAKSWHALHHLKVNYGCTVNMQKIDEYNFDSKFFDIEYRMRCLTKLRSA
jgi:hypothetical protein